MRQLVARPAELVALLGTLVQGGVLWTAGRSGGPELPVPLLVILAGLVAAAAMVWSLRRTRA